MPTCLCQEDKCSHSDDKVMIWPLDTGKGGREGEIGTKGTLGTVTPMHSQVI